jgi:hypothetical protein
LALFRRFPLLRRRQIVFLDMLGPHQGIKPKDVCTMPIDR